MFESILKTLQRLDAGDQVLTMHEDVARVDAEGVKRADADLLPWFARQLESIRTKLYEVEHPDLIAATGELLPFASDVEDGAETFIYYMFDSRGIAEFLTDYAADEAPEATIEGAQKTGRVHMMQMKYHWTVSDVIRARKTGTDLKDMKAKATRRGHDMRLHITALWGREDLGLKGFVNNEAISVTLAADIGGGVTDWASKSIEQIVEDCAPLIHGTEELTNDVISMTDMRIATTEYNRLSRRRLGPGDGHSTFLEHLQKVFPGVKFGKMRELQASKSSGNLATDSALAYHKKAEYCDLVHPRRYTQLPVQREGMKFVVYTHSTFGGVRMPHPLSVHRLDGIGAS